MLHQSTYLWQTTTAAAAAKKEWIWGDLNRTPNRNTNDIHIIEFKRHTYICESNMNDVRVEIWAYFQFQLYIIEYTLQWSPPFRLPFPPTHCDYIVLHLIHIFLCSFGDFGCFPRDLPFDIIHLFVAQKFYMRNNSIGKWTEIGCSSSSNSYTDDNNKQTTKQ